MDFRRQILCHWIARHQRVRMERRETDEAHRDKERWFGRGECRVLVGE